MNIKKNLIRTQFKKAQKIYIIGKAKSGTKVANYCQSKGKIVYISDQNISASNKKYQILNNSLLYLGQHSKKFVDESDMIIRSASIPLDLEVIIYAKSIGKPVYSLVEFVLSTIDSSVIILTGSNGKTTFSNLLNEIEGLKDYIYIISKDKSQSIVDILDIKKKYKYIIIEMSVDELVGNKHIFPMGLIVTNLYIHSNHLERYGDFNNYIKAKLGWMGNNSDGFTIIAEKDLEKFIFKNIDINYHNKFNMITIDSGLKPQDRYIQYTEKLLRFMESDYLINHNNIKKILEENVINRLMKKNISGIEFYFDKNAKNIEGVEWTRKLLNDKFLIVTFNREYLYRFKESIIFEKLEDLDSLIDNASSICRYLNIRKVVILPGIVLSEKDFKKVFKLIK